MWPTGNFSTLLIEIKLRVDSRCGWHCKKKHFSLTGILPTSRRPAIIYWKEPYTPNTLPIFGLHPCSSFKYYKFTTTRGHLKYSECMQTIVAAGAPLQTPLGSSQRSPDPLAGGEGWLPLPKDPIPALGHSGLIPITFLHPSSFIFLEICLKGTNLVAHISRLRIYTSD